MKKNLRKFFLSVLFAAAGSFALSAIGLADQAGTHYTKVNLWYEKPMEILSTNYHKGAMLPVGTEVEVVAHNKKKIEFVDRKTGMKFRIELVKKYTNLDETEFFDRYFSKKNVLNGAEYASFSATEKENIQNGTIEKGMSKNAVLIAYGYPPTHQTPTIRADAWTYWKSRLSHFMIQFKDDKIDRMDV